MAATSENEGQPMKLTPNEERVLHVLKRECRNGRTLALNDVYRLTRPMYPFAADTALRGLLSLRLVEQPSRGFYAPAEVSDER